MGHGRAVRTWGSCGAWKGSTYLWPVFGVEKLYVPGEWRGSTYLWPVFGVEKLYVPGAWRGSTYLGPVCGMEGQYVHGARVVLGRAVRTRALCAA